MRCIYIAREEFDILKGLVNYPTDINVPINSKSGTFMQEFGTTSDFFYRESTLTVDSTLLKR